MNCLIREQAVKDEIPQSDIHLTEREAASDEGIDRWTLSSAPNQEWIPSGRTVWQLKAYEAGPQVLANELINASDELREWIAQGANYVVCLSKELDTRKYNSRLKALRNAWQQVNAAGTLRLYQASHLVSWSRSFPALLLLRFFERGVEGLSSVDAWAADPRLQGPFTPSAGQGSVIDGFRAALRERGHSGGRFRLIGRGGFGKTRTVLEALKDPHLRRRTIYARQYATIRPGFFQWLLSVPDPSVILVVDGCDVPEHQELEGVLGGTGPGVSLITIGPGHGNSDPRSGRFSLDRMQEDALLAVVKELHPGMSLDKQRYAIRLSSGYVRALVFLSQYITDHPEKAAAEYAQEDDLSTYLEALVGADPSGNVRSALDCVSLFVDLGVDGEMEGELAAVATFFGRNLAQLKSGLREGFRRGVVDEIGRRRAVTPEILAIQLAAEIWAAQQEGLLRLYDELPPKAREPFLRRLGSLGENAHTRTAIRTLLASPKLLASIDDLNSPERGELLFYLASADPDGGLDSLERLIGTASVEELRRLNGGRRGVVWALEMLVWSEQHFERAALLLLRLAEAENERYANNATGLWHQLFRPLLPGTAVPDLERHALLERIIRDEALPMRRRELAIEALGEVFDTHVSRTESVESIGGRPLPPESRPITVGQLREILGHAFTLLKVAEELAPLKAFAQNTILANTRQLFLQGQGEAALATLEGFTQSGSPDLRARIAGELGSVIAYDARAVPREQIERAQVLRDRILESDFDTRLRRWIGRGGPEDYNLETSEAGRHERVSLALAREAWNEREKLEQNWLWLVSEDAQRSWLFFLELGGLDGDHTLINRLELSGIIALGQRLAWSGLMTGARLAGQEKWFWEHVESVRNQPHSPEAILELLWRQVPDDRAAAFLEDMVGTGALQAKGLRVLIYGNWIGKIGLPAAKELVASILAPNEPDANVSVLELLGMRLAFAKHEATEFRDEIWTVLDRTAGSAEGMAVHNWGTLAKLMFRSDPRRAARLALQVFLSGEYISERDERLEMFQAAAALDPDGAWEELATLLESAGFRKRSLGLSLKGRLLLGLPVERILKWAKEHGESAIALLVSFTGIGPDLTPLQRGLLSLNPRSKVVRSSLAAEMFTGVHSGSHHEWLEARLSWAEAWAKDRDPDVRAFAKSLIPGLKDDVSRTKQWEDERDR